jgi:diguanylate cyclase (GGDEF)-like protein
MERERGLGGLGGLAPFAGAAVLAWIAVIIGSSIDWSQYAVSVVLLLLAGIMSVVRITHDRAGGWLGVVPNSYVFLLAVAVLRNSAGGLSSGAASLSLIPVFHTALYSRSRRELWLVLAGVAVFYLAPTMLVGGAGYPNTQYRSALLFLLLSAMIGFATQGIVDRVREQAGEARRRERTLEQVSTAVRGLLASSHARVDVCEAAKTISDACVAVLFEPVPETGALRATAMAGVERAAAEVPGDQLSPLHQAFATGEAVMINEGLERKVAHRELWEAAGKPSSALYQPLTRGGRRLGVLIVAWKDTARAGGPQATVVELLAHEAAAVIERADEFEEMSDLAQSDALTGLPNRRAWDAGVKEAVSDHREFVVAMFDIDHFKAFNDAHGHPAGDRLLKETSAAWRDQLREGDLLARLGGEEFGLLLIDTDRRTATGVIERLRGCVSQGRTCSAGLAVRNPGEPADSVIARADRALYEAKARGRNRACISA